MIAIYICTEIWDEVMFKIYHTTDSPNFEALYFIHIWCLENDSYQKNGLELLLDHGADSAIRGAFFLP